MKKKILIFLLLFAIGYGGLSQVAINTDGSFADESSILDVTSTEKGVLFPRMNDTQRDNIGDPVDGLIIFNTETGCYNYYFGGDWFALCGKIIVNCIDFNFSGSGNDCDYFFIGGTLSGAPDGATITSVTYTASIYSNSGTSWCPAWYEIDFWVNGSYISTHCNVINQSYVGLDGEIFNGQLIRIRAWDTDVWCDFVNMELSITVCYE